MIFGQELGVLHTSTPSMVVSFWDMLGGSVEVLHEQHSISVHLRVKLILGCQEVLDEFGPQ